MTTSDALPAAEEESAYATGRALLINAWVDLTYARGNHNSMLQQLRGAVPASWRPGPLPFTHRQAEIDSPYVGHAVPEGKTAAWTEEVERRENFSRSTANILYGVEGPPGLEDGKFSSEAGDDSTSMRWHTRSVTRFNEALVDIDEEIGAPSKHRVIGAELLFAVTHASAPSIGHHSAKDEGASRRRAVLVLHLGYAGKTESETAEVPLDSQDMKWFEAVCKKPASRAIALTAFQRALEKPSRGSADAGRPEESSSCSLRIVTGDQVSDEDYGVIYPVLTDLSLNLSPQAENPTGLWNAFLRRIMLGSADTENNGPNAQRDEETLLIRELATVTDSKSHGTQGPNDRLDRIQRTRDPSASVRLSDSWAVMPTGHGALFFATSQDDENDFTEARLYVSSLYIDYILLVRLEARLAQDLRNKIQRSIQSSRDLPLEDVLKIRRRLMGLRTSFSKVGEAEKRTGKALVTFMRKSLATDTVLRDIIEESEDIVEITEIKQSKQEEVTDKRLQAMLAILTVVGLPVTIFGTALSAYSTNEAVIGAFGVMIAFLAIIATAMILISRRRLGKKELPQGDT